MPSRSSPQAMEISEAVMQLRPRLAVFDCDGTLWSGDGGEDFLYWEITHTVFPAEKAEWLAQRYASYKRGKVSEAQMCGEMTAIHQGMAASEIAAIAESFFSEVLEPRIFSEMRTLTEQLAQSSCELWAVSSSNEWLIRAGLRRFPIPATHVLAASVLVESGRATGRLIRVPTGEAKADVLRDLQSSPTSFSAIRFTMPR